MVVTNDEVSEIAAPVERANASAQHLVREPQDPVAHEPSGALECFAAVEGLAEAFRAAGKTFEEVIDNSRGGAESLSTDTFQGLSEVVQNANDVAASRVSFALDGDTLVVRHNGRAVNLRDLRAIAVPWLTTKSDDATATGRFGVGLSTLHRFAETFEVHSGDYHVRVGDPFVANLDSSPGESKFVEDTILRVVFREGAATEADFVRWYEQWDDSALMFLAHVREVGFSTPDTSRDLTLDVESSVEVSWNLTADPVATADEVASADDPEVAQKAAPAPAVTRGTVPATVSVQRAPDGRSWLLATCDVASPEGADRVRKRKGETTPIGVALPLNRHAPRDGTMYAGLPVTGLPGVPALVNAQFDPFTTRQGLQASAWNLAVAALVDRLWLRAIEHLFATSPRKAWRCVPWPQKSTDDADRDSTSTEGPAAVPGDGQDTTAELVAWFRRLIDERSNDLGSRLKFEIDDGGVLLAQLAIEAEPITGLLTDAEVTTIAGVPHRLPDEVRDKRGQWRRVMDVWRRTHPSLPPEVTIFDAVRVLNTPTDRSVSNIIQLTAVALNAGLGPHLESLPCLVDDEHRTHLPPRPKTAYALTRDRTGLAHALHIGTALHLAYLAEEPSAEVVVQWLLDTGRLIETDDVTVLERLAAAGRADNPVESPLTDDQVRSIRIAMEPLGSTEWTRLGRGIGKAVFVDAYRYDHAGERVAVTARPGDAYQPKRIDSIRDGFATAAGTTPGLTWVANRYQDVLRSSMGRDRGLGTQRFLRALGCSTAPRLIPHRLNHQRFANPRKGLPRNVVGSPTERGRAMLDLEADFTLNDIDSPDLTAVLINIAAETSARRRRERASAVLNTLGRGWRDLGDSAEVDAAWAHQHWRVRGPVRAFWLWKAASIAWMDNASGNATAPSRLRRSSASTRALFGNDPSGLVHQEFASIRPEILNALGVSGEPKTPDLIRRLIELRDGDQTDETLAECGVVYQALASRLDEGRASIGLTDKQLREQLSQRGGLIRTATRWAPPTELRRGKPIFGTRRDFTPSIPRTERLWEALQVPRPNVDDCLKVINEIAKTKTKPDADDEPIIIETLRTLDGLLQGRNTAPVRTIRDKLRTLPLWTSTGWQTKRPIYTTQDPQLIEGISTSLPVWSPGVDSTQFTRLLTHLRVTPIEDRQVRVHQPDLAAFDDDATNTFTAALEHFKADLTRNDPAVDDTLRITWNELAAFEVRTHPRLQATLSLDDTKSFTIAIRAIVDDTAIYIREPDDLERVDGLGRALAALFNKDSRTISHAWLAAVQADREGRAAHALVLAAEQQATQASDAAERMTKLNLLSTEAITAATKKAAAKQSASKKTSKRASTTTTTPPPEPVRKPRVLVDPNTLVVTNTGGTIVNGTGPTPKKSATSKPSGKPTASKTNADDTSTGNPPVDPGKAPPKPSTTYRVYTENDKERLGLEIASRVLKGDENALVDIRNQRGVGADAIDDLRRFYELKVSAGEEPTSIALEPSQIRLAMTEPDFFLVIVSNLEGKNARPQVRVIHDPLSQLAMKKSSKVTFTGIQEATGLVFRLDHSAADGPDE